MFIDHRTASALQERRIAEARRLAERKHAIERLESDPEPAFRTEPRVSLLRSLVTRLRARPRSI